jgi:hypothetical protein
VRVIGVLPKEFEFAPAGNAEIWVPMHIKDDMLTRRSLRWMRVLGRLAGGATLQQARAEMSVINSVLAKAYPAQNAATQVDFCWRAGAPRS